MIYDFSSYTYAELITLRQTETDALAALDSMAAYVRSARQRKRDAEMRAETESMLQAVITELASRVTQ
jgi:hypothetical protein